MPEEYDYWKARRMEDAARIQGQETGRVIGQTMLAGLETKYGTKVQQLENEILELKKKVATLENRGVI